MAKFFYWSMVVLLFLSFQKVGAENPWTTKVPMSVTIYNGIAGGVVEVDCVCHKCHDVSVALQHKSLAWRSAFQFEFKMSVLGITYVWCKMVWGKNWNAFKVWNGPGIWGTQRMPCQQCVLEMKGEGIYQGQQGAQLVLVKPWMDDAPPMD